MTYTLINNKKCSCLGLSIQNNLDIGGSIIVKSSTYSNLRNINTENIKNTASIRSSTLQADSTVITPSIYVQSMANMNNMTVTGTANFQTLTVASNLTANNLAVSGAFTPASVNTTSITTTNLNLSGPLSGTSGTFTGTLNSNSLVSSGATINGDITCTGKITSNDLEVTGLITFSNLNVSGILNADSAIIAGALNVGSSINVPSINSTVLIEAHDITMDGNLSADTATFSGITTFQDNVTVDGSLTTNSFNIDTLTVNTLATFNCPINCDDTVTAQAFNTTGIINCHSVVATHNLNGSSCTVDNLEVSTTAIINPALKIYTELTQNDGEAGITTTNILYSNAGINIASGAMFVNGVGDLTCHDLNVTGTVSFPVLLVDDLNVRGDAYFGSAGAPVIFMNGTDAKIELGPSNWSHIDGITFTKAKIHSSLFEVSDTGNIQCEQLTSNAGITTNLINVAGAVTAGAYTFTDNKIFLGTGIVSCEELNVGTMTPVPDIKFTVTTAGEASGPSFQTTNYPAESEIDLRAEHIYIGTADVGTKMGIEYNIGTHSATVLSSIYKCLTYSGGSYIETVEINDGIITLSNKLDPTQTAILDYSGLTTTPSHVPPEPFGLILTPTREDLDLVASNFRSYHWNGAAYVSNVSIDGTTGDITTVGTLSAGNIVFTGTFTSSTIVYDDLILDSVGAPRGLWNVADGIVAEKISIGIVDPVTPNFTVDSSGDVTCEDITVNGNFTLVGSMTTLTITSELEIQDAIFHVTDSGTGIDDFYIQSGNPTFIKNLNVGTAPASINASIDSAGKVTAINADFASGNTVIDNTGNVNAINFNATTNVSSPLISTAEVNCSGILRGNSLNINSGTVTISNTGVGTFAFSLVAPTYTSVSDMSIHAFGELDITSLGKIDIINNSTDDITIQTTVNDINILAVGKIDIISSANLITVQANTTLTLEGASASLESTTGDVTITSNNDTIITSGGSAGLEGQNVVILANTTDVDITGTNDVNIGASNEIDITSTNNLIISSTAGSSALISSTNTTIGSNGTVLVDAIGNLDVVSHSGTLALEGNRITFVSDTAEIVFSSQTDFTVTTTTGLISMTAANTVDISSNNGTTISSTNRLVLEGSHIDIRPIKTYFGNCYPTYNTLAENYDLITSNDGIYFGTGDALLSWNVSSNVNFAAGGAMRIRPAYSVGAADLRIEAVPGGAIAGTGVTGYLNLSYTPGATNIYVQGGGMPSGTGNDVQITGGGLLVQVTSTEDSKENITDFVCDPSWIIDLNPIQFTYKNPNPDIPDPLFTKQNIGFSAEEIQTHCDEEYLLNKDEEGTLIGYKNTALNTLLLMLCKQQQAQIDKYQAIFETLATQEGFEWITDML